MGDFEIEKDVPMNKRWGLSEYVKNLIGLMQVGDSFSFPIKDYMVIKRYVEKHQKGWEKKFAIRTQKDDKARIWRTR